MTTTLGAPASLGERATGRRARASWVMAGTCCVLAAALAMPVQRTRPLAGTYYTPGRFVGANPVRSRVRDVYVRVGERVAAGELLLTFDRATSEPRRDLAAEPQIVQLTSPLAGIVTRLDVAVGDEIAPGESVVVVERKAPAAPPRAIFEGPWEQVRAITIGAPVQLRSEECKDGLRGEVVAVRPLLAVATGGEQPAGVVRVTITAAAEEASCVADGAAVGGRFLLARESLFSLLWRRLDKDWFAPGGP